jgi:hypothetical protein
MPQLNVLFWNVKKKDLTEQIVNLARSKEVDILVLAENKIKSLHLIKALNTEGAYYFQDHPLANCPKITIVTRFHYDLIEPIDVDPRRMTTRLVRLITGETFLFTALHYLDKGNFTAESQEQNAYLTAKRLIDIEFERGINRHIVVGDFNMNPFEKGMIGVLGFHGTMSSQVASVGSRIVQDIDYPYFYNPTWSLFGDLNKEVSGTYYYRRAQHVCYEWNMFDQVLIRPSMVNNFVKDSLTIVQTDGVTSLLTDRNIPNQKSYSDHLPLFFTLRF